jgi:hypothetical protein
MPKMVINNFGNKNFMQPMSVFKKNLGSWWFFGCLGIPILSSLLASG